jgi:hypothetical protein
LIPYYSGLMVLIFFFTEQNQIAMQVDQGNQYTRELEAVCDARIHINKDHLNALTIRDLRRIGSMPKSRIL